MTDCDMRFGELGMFLTRCACACTFNTNNLASTVVAPASLLPCPGLLITIFFWFFSYLSASGLAISSCFASNILLHSALLTCWYYEPISVWISIILPCCQWAMSFCMYHSMVWKWILIKYHKTPIIERTVTQNYTFWFFLSHNPFLSTKV